MSYLKLPLTLEQIATVERELERLFVLQDRPFPESKKTIFVQEIRDTFYPFPAIIAGIRALAGEDLKAIKLHTIINEIKKFIVFSDKRSDCKHCGGGGLISTIRDDGIRFAFVCVCESGKDYKDVLKWNGQVSFDLNGSTFDLHERVLLGDKFDAWRKERALNGNT